MSWSQSHTTNVGLSRAVKKSQIEKQVLPPYLQGVLQSLQALDLELPFSVALVLSVFIFYNTHLCSTEDFIGISGILLITRYMSVSVSLLVMLSSSIVSQLSLSESPLVRHLLLSNCSSQPCCLLHRAWKARVS